MNLASSLAILTALQAGSPPARVVVEPASVQVPAGTAVQLTAAAYTADGTRVPGMTIRWLSLDEDLATVAGDGTVTAVRPGQVRIAAMVPGGRAGFATVTIPELPAATIDFTPPTTDVLAGASAPTRARARTRLGEPLAATLAYESADTSIAVVDRTGRVFGRQPGQTTVRARAGSVVASLPVRVAPNDAQDYTIHPAATTVRTGDVVRFRVAATAGDGSAVGPLEPAWLLGGAGAQIEPEGGEGVFVAEEPGTYRVTALIGEAITSSTTVDVVRRHVPARLTAVGRGAIATHHSGDTWAFEGVDGRDYAYIGTFYHDWMKVWDVTDPAAPALTDSIQLDARRINDVKIHPNNRIGIVTREGASNRRNGLVVLDLANPAHPTVLSQFTDSLTGGVHNVWIEPNDIVYAAHNGTSDMHIIDIADPAAPRQVGRWGLDKEAKTLHDIIVQEGYAYLSYWDDGVVILDVGAGTHGGTPTQPTFVSRFAYPTGNTHVAWRAGRYLFLGDEIFPPNWNADAPIEARGYIHVVDVHDIEHPVEVARYEVPEAGAHNVWVEGDRLYVGYYQGGLRVVDISGELRGDLYRQGRELAALKTTDANTTVPNWPMTWGAQIFKGHIFTSDLNSGLWILRLDEEVIVP